MMIPTIHLNGTSGERLAEQAEHAAQAVQAALEAVCQAAPNGRDYYPQGPTAFAGARAEHVRRECALLSVRDELVQLATEIRDAMDARVRR